MEQDTSPEMRAWFYAQVAKATPEQRARSSAALTQGVRRLLEAALRQEFPAAGNEEIRARITTRIYGREFASRYFSVPEDAR